MDTIVRIAGPVSLASGDTVVFTAAGGTQTYTIFDLRIVNNSGSSVSVKVGINGTTDDLLVIPLTVINSHTSLIDNGRIVLSGTDTLVANASATGTTLTASGMVQDVI